MASAGRSDPPSGVKEFFRRAVNRGSRLLRRATRIGPDGATANQPDTRTPMVGGLVIALMTYLSVLGFGALWSSWTLWLARPAVVVEEAWPAPAPTADPAAAPVITSLIPDTVVFGVDPPVVRVFGTGFSAASQVLLDGVRVSSAFIPPHQMLVTLTEGDFRQSRTMAINVLRGDASSASVPVRVETESAAVVRWVPPFGDASAPTTITVETRFILLVMLFGGIGGLLASFNSLSSYRGEGRLMKSWFLHYWVSPFLSAGVALLMYMVVRAGFLAGSNVRFDGGATPWGIVTVSALAGLFYDKTLIKLRDVFITLFAPKDDRSGKLVGNGSSASEGPLDLEVTTTGLESAVVNAGYEQRLQARGGEEPYSWSVEPDLPGGLVLDPISGLISGQPIEQKARAPYEFTVSDMRMSSDSVRLDLEVRQR